MSGQRIYCRIIRVRLIFSRGALWIGSRALPALDLRHPPTLAPKLAIKNSAIDAMYNGKGMFVALCPPVGAVEGPTPRLLADERTVRRHRLPGQVVYRRAAVAQHERR